MSAEDVQLDAHLARVRALHVQFFGHQQPASPLTSSSIIPPIEGEEVLFTNPDPFAKSQDWHTQNPQRPGMFTYAEPPPSSLPLPRPYSMDQNPVRRVPAAGLFRQIDWKNDEARHPAATLKRAPSMSSSASGSTKVKAPKEDGIFRKTSQRCTKISRALMGRSRRPSGSDMMEGVEASPVLPENGIPSIVTSSNSLLHKQPSARLPTRVANLSHQPRHDTPQPIHGEGASRTTRPAGQIAQRYPNQHLYPADAFGGDAARRAAAASNVAGSRYHAFQQTMQAFRPDYQVRRDSYRRSISTMPGASDSGADLLDGSDIDMMDEEKALPVKIDPVAAVPTEIATLIFSHLDPRSLKACRIVSRSWASIAVDPLIWRDQYLKQYQKQVYVEPAPIEIGGAGVGRPNVAIQPWQLMHDARRKIDENWAKGENGGKAVYLSGHTDSVYCVQFDEDKIITGSRDRTIRVWDINTLRCLKVIGGPTVKPIPGPKRLRTVDPSKLLGIVESVNGTREGDAIYHIPSDYHSASILCLQYDDEILVTGSSDNDLLVWDVKTFEPIRRLKHHGGGVLDVAFDSKHIVSCSKDCTIVVWDRKTLEPIRSLTGHRGPVNAVQLRGHLLVSASGDGVARLWDLNKMECQREFPQKERGLAAVEFSDDAKYVLAGGNDHTTYKFDVSTGEEVKTFVGHTQLVRSLFLDTQNRRVVSGSYDLDLRVYDYDTGKLLGKFGEWTTSWMLAAKSDYRRIVSTSQDGRILIIDFGRDEYNNLIDGVKLLESKTTPEPCFAY